MNLKYKVWQQVLWKILVQIQKKDEYQVGSLVWEQVHWEVRRQVFSSMKKIVEEMCISSNEYFGTDCLINHLYLGYYE
jgi:hypothetical protein